jgi:dienelactone hydrolase
MREAATLLLREHPGVTDAITGGLPGFLNGAAGPLAPLVPDTYEGVLTALLGLGSPHGLFENRPVTASAQGPSAPYTGTTGGGLDSLRELWASANQLNSNAQADPDGSAVRILRTVEGGVVRWVVQVPGTQQWNPMTGSDPSDATTNIELMDDGQALILPAIVQAMREAGIGAGEEVMVMGHSQGGIAAMALANDDAVRAEFDVTTVFTGGSPVGRFELPPGITAVSLEHLQDPVPRLDSEVNPDLPGWTTVTRDVGSELAAEDSEGRRIAAEVGVDYVINPIASHSGTRYEHTAGLLDSAAERADGTDPDDESARRAVEAIEPFLNGPADYQDWTLIRSDP